MQGWDWESAENWYQGVKEFSDPTGEYVGREAEGWAFGGANMCKMDITLKRLMTLREDGLLKGKDWIHFLGTAQLDWSCYLTLIQRQIRKHINENITISFDCASPFIATAHGLVYTNAQHTTKRWSVIMDKAFDNKGLAGSNIPFPFESEIGRRLTVGDICHYDLGIRKSDKELGKDVKFDHLNADHYHVVPRKNKLDKIPNKTSWDSFSYALMMGHNVYCHIVAVQRAQQLMDIEIAKTKDKLTWEHWHKLKDAESNADQYSDWVPRNILYFSSFIEDLFNTKTKDEAFAMIDSRQGKAFLTSLEGARLQGGNAQNKFNSLFDVEEVTKASEVDLENPEDQELRDLEQSVS